MTTFKQFKENVKGQPVVKGCKCDEWWCESCHPLVIECGWCNSDHVADYQCKPKRVESKRLYTLQATRTLQSKQ